MTSEQLYTALGDVSDSYIRQAHQSHKPRRRWAALAACLCLIAGLAAGLLRPKGGSEDPAMDMAAITFNGACYEATNHPEVLARYGLPDPLTADLAGERVAYVRHNGVNGFETTASATDMALYQYAPAPCRAVCLLWDGAQWCAAIFCGYLLPDGDSHVEMAEFLRVYGVQSSADIAGITEVDWRRTDPVAAAITDRSAIDAFFDAATALIPYGSDSFSAIQFGHNPEDRTTEARTAFAGDRRVLRLETTAGLRFYLDLHPSHGWLCGNMVRTYYRIDASMAVWLSENLIS